MLHDPVRYPDPESFKPERFFRDDGTLNDDKVQAAFGFGRRLVCMLCHTISACRRGQADIANRQGVLRTIPRQSLDLDNGRLHTGIVRY